MKSRSPAFLPARLVLLGTALGQPLQANSVIGAGPYYQFDVVAEVGMPLDSGVTITNEPNTISDDPIPEVFSMNDAGDLLANYRVWVEDTEHGDYTDYASALAPMEGGLLQVDKRQLVKHASLGNDGTIFIGNRIFPAGGSMITPGGFVTEETFYPDGSPKPLRPLLPILPAVSSTGGKYFTALDFDADWETTSPFGIYRVDSVGNPSGSTLLTRLNYGPRWSVYPEADIELGNNGWLVANEYLSDAALGPEFDTHDIFVVKPNGTKRLIASVPLDDPDQGLSRLTGLTRDGAFFAYVDRSVAGDAIMIGQPDETQPFGDPVEVVTANQVIGIFDDAGRTPITFASIDLESVSILRHNKDNDTEIEGDTLWVTFKAQPTSASRKNPRVVPSQPLQFRESMGIWAVRVDIQGGSGSELHLNASGPICVVQVGDKFSGEEITDVQLWKAFGTGTKTRDGDPRTPGKNDHVIGFRVTTASRMALLRGIHFDDDEDGLPNHWEEPGGGIDADRDGIADLSLQRFGADSQHKDMFLEIDWLPPRTSGIPVVWENKPYAESLFNLIDIYAQAPVTNPDGTTGIRLHVDAGAGTDPDGVPLNFSTGEATPGELQGGDEVMPAASRLDVVTVGEGAAASYGAIQAGTMDEIKEQYFGSADKWAREFAFRYAVLSDFMEIRTAVDLGDGAESLPTVGGVAGDEVTVALNPPVSPLQAAAWLRDQSWMGFTDGTAAGQIRRFTFDPTGGIIINGSGQITGLKLQRQGPGWTPAPSPGSGVVLFSSSTGKAEGFVRNLMDPDAEPTNINRLGGNDLVIATANLFAFPIQYYIPTVARTLAHELGHTLALGHGGREAAPAFLGDEHWSLMSYTHQLRVIGESPLLVVDPEVPGALMPVPPPPEMVSVTDPPGVVWSYSDGTDFMGFNEWDYIRLETWSTPWHLGNSTLRYRGLPVEDDGAPAYYLDQLGDVEAPRLAWQLPAPPLRATLGATFAVEFSATDNGAVATLTASFDADGNGTATGAAEVKTPVDLGGNRYRAEFSISGAAGTRTLKIAATDAAGNVAELEPRVLAGSGSFPDSGVPVLYPIQPISGATLPSFGSTAIRFSAVDYGSGMLRAAVRFDVNGDGSVGTDEEFSAAPNPAASGEWIALVPPPGDTAGSRTLTLVATDLWLNTATYDLSLSVIPPDGTPPVISVTGGPADGSAMAYGSQFLIFQVTASDAGGLSRLNLTVDANGDGVIATNTSLENTTVTLFGSPASTSGPQYLSTNFTGPGGPRLITISCTDAAGNTSSVTRTVVLTDTVKPSVRITAPGDGDPVRLGAPLTVRGRVTDNAGLATSRVSFDLDGDGTVQPDEQFDPVLANDGTFTLELTALTGPAGRRSLLLAADDITGFHAETMTSVIVGNGLLELPPATGERWRVGSSSVVSVELPGGTTAGGTVRMTFDVNGDGDTSDPGEEQDAPITVPYEPHAPLPRAVGVFGSISGPPGVRILSVGQTGVEGSSGTCAITVDGIPDGGVSDRVAHIPLTSSLIEALGDGHSVPTPVAQLGNVTFFTAITPLEGAELWRSDGTPEGTWLLRDLDPGYFEGLAGDPSGSDPAGFVVFAGKLFFTASEQAGQTFTATIGSGRELWTSDGTVAGTSLFKDINPGRIPAQGSDSSDPEILGIFAGKLWFLANDGTNGVRLWQCDGTPAGTVPMSGSPLFVRNPEISPSGAVLGSRLLFLSNHGQDLWQTDGTLAGTSRIYQRGQPGKTVSFDKLVAADGRLYLRGDNGSAHELWTTDGTAAGTILLKSIAAVSGNPPDLAALGSRAVFAAETPVEGREAWVTDGTVAGTTLLRDLWPGTAPSSSSPANGRPRGFVSLGDRVMFGGLSPDTGDEPWVTDGTTGGTQVLADLTVTAWDSRFLSTGVPPGSAIDSITADANGAWWAANDDKRRTGSELWHWDRLNPPYLVRDLSPLAATRIFPFPSPAYYGPAGSSPSRLMILGSQLWFRATDPIYGDELFVSDGTSTGTRRVTNLTSSTAPASLVRASEVVVAGFDGVHASLHFKGSGAARLWKDASFSPQGAPQNLVDYGGGIAFSMKVKNTLGYLVQDVFRWPDGAPQPEQVASFENLWRLAGHNGSLWMAGRGTNGVQALHRHDGTATSLVTTLYGFNAALTLADFVADETRVFFTASATTDRELWVSDASGVRRVLSASGVELATVTGLTRFGGKIWFTAPNVIYNVVWTTDGTDAGTAPFHDGTLTSEWLLPERKPVVTNGRLLFSAIPLVDPYPSWSTLWSSDGTVAGTVELKIEATTEPIPRIAEDPRHLTISGNRVFFTALSRLSNGADNLGEELWLTDGTEAGTRFVKNIYPRQPGDIPDSSSEPRALTPLGDGIVFVAATPGEGRELCISDGTEAGTHRLKVLWPGVNSPSISSITAAGGKAWFAARTADGGRELWSSDGTEAGTVGVEDLLPGPTSSDPRVIGEKGGKLHFVARDHGDDWAYRTVNVSTTTLTDSDNDEWPDEWETLFGTDLANSGSYPAVEILAANPVGGFIDARFRRPVSWSADGFEIEVEGSGDLEDWSILGTTPLGVLPAGFQEIVTVRIGLSGLPSGKAFVRLRVTR